MSKAEPFDAEAVYGTLSTSEDWRRKDAESCVATRREIIRALDAAYSRGRADMASECVRDYAK